MYKFTLFIVTIVLAFVGQRALGQRVTGQVEVKGTVYDRSQLFAMPGVSVLGSSGAGTITDSTGHYQIRLSSGDSIYFSYLGKYTDKIPLSRIVPGYPLDMSLAVNVDSLPLVVVRPKIYRYDSLANRDEYRRVFDYQPEYITGGNGGVGFNLDMLFSGRKNRQMLSLQRRLEEEERDKYVDHRFNRTLVKKITGLQQPALDTFMRAYRPSYEFILNCENDYEFYKYIRDCGLYFSKLQKEEQ
ncbi:peptidase associated/transthyretin-like domain-containing protein [Flavitalea flava]